MLPVGQLSLAPASEVLENWPFLRFLTQILPSFFTETTGELHPFLEITVTTVVESQQSGIVENGVTKNETAFV